MKFSDCIEDYLNHIKHEKGLARTTCEQYGSWLRHFCCWLCENGYPDPTIDVFAVPILRRFQYYKSKQGRRPRAILSAFSPLRGLGDYLVSVGAIEHNPVKLLTLPKKDAAVRLVVKDTDVFALFEACERQPRPRQVALCRAVLSVLAYGGLRREEACDLLTTDVNLADLSILVRMGKGSKSRTVYVCTEALTALREWLTFREADTKHPYLFSIDRARRLHHVGIANLIETLKATAGLRENDAVKPHGLRHWCGTNLLRNGANLRDVQQFLGHSDLKTTALYLHTSEEQLRGISELTAMRVRTPQPEDRMVVTPRQRIATSANADRPRLHRIAR